MQYITNKDYLPKDTIKVMVGIESEKSSEVSYEDVLDFCMNTGFLDVLVDLKSGSNIDLILR
jgi:hypothetical protein